VQLKKWIFRHQMAVFFFMNVDIIWHVLCYINSLVNVDLVSGWRQHVDIGDVLEILTVSILMGQVKDKNIRNIGNTAYIYKVLWKKRTRINTKRPRKPKILCKLTSRASSRTKAVKLHQYLLYSFLMEQRLGFFSFCFFSLFFGTPDLIHFKLKSAEFLLWI
jgi:hypothetical protein